MLGRGANQPYGAAGVVSNALVSLLGVIHPKFIVTCDPLRAIGLNERSEDPVLAGSEQGGSG